jgi:UPF0755 protein
MKRNISISIGVLLVALTLMVHQILWAPNSFEGDRFITVSKGESFTHVVALMENSGIIRNRFLFELAGRILRLTTRMQIGAYHFKSGMSNKEILEDLRYGKTIEMVTVTIPEGLTSARQSRVLATTLGIDPERYMAFVNDTNFARTLNISAPSLEGYLMPESYRLYWQADEIDVIKAQIREFWNVFDDTLRAEAELMGRSIHEILTLASIVEKETSIDSERAIIASVYYNRLQKRMRLEADPTIQYLLEDGPRRLHYTDLKRESDYNTYLHYGLPPGPIGNPGKASILAAIHPRQNKYLFFVANGSGGHTFSRTFEEHRKAVRQLRKLRAEKEALAEEG